MKKLEIVIKPGMLETLKNILEEHKCGGMTIVSVMGYGNQKGHTTEVKGLKVNLNLLPKIMAIAVVHDDVVEELLADIHEKISTSSVGDGKVFITDIADAMRIRTAERGGNAI
jgi:nitrogen regulatory protein P-II 1